MIAKTHISLAIFNGAQLLLVVGLLGIHLCSSTEVPTQRQADGLAGVTVSVSALEAAAADVEHPAMAEQYSLGRQREALAEIVVYASP